MKTVLIVLAVLLALVLAAGYAMYRYMIVRRKPRNFFDLDAAKTPEERGIIEDRMRRREWLEAWGYETVTITNHAGATLYGYLLRARQPTNRTVLAVHGYTSNAFYEYLYFAPMYLEQFGMNMLLVDDFAHGRSDGKRIGFGYMDRLDCLQWARWIVDNLGGDSEITLQGVSMGAATVLMAAAEESLPANVRYVVADCSFTSLKDQVRHLVPPAVPLGYVASVYCKLLAGYFFRDASPLARVPYIRVPVLFVHGEADDYVPTWMVHPLFEACRTPKELLLVPGAKHGGSMYVAPQLYAQAAQRLFTLGGG